MMLPLLGWFVILAITIWVTCAGLFAAYVTQAMGGRSTIAGTLFFSVWLICVAGLGYITYSLAPFRITPV